MTDFFWNTVFRTPHYESPLTEISISVSPVSITSVTETNDCDYPIQVSLSNGEIIDASLW